MTTSSLALPTVNSAGETALDAAKRLQYTQCIELVSSASAPSSSLAIYRGSDCKTVQFPAESAEHDNLISQ